MSEEVVVVKKKDKKIVENERRTDEQLRVFLDVLPPAGVNADFHVLHSAYKSMKPDEFERFVGFFREAGKDIEAKNTDGETVRDMIKTHRHGDEYLPFL